MPEYLKIRKNIACIREWKKWRNRKREIKGERDTIL